MSFDLITPQKTETTSNKIADNTNSDATSKANLSTQNQTDSAKTSNATHDAQEKNSELVHSGTLPHVVIVQDQVKQGAPKASMPGPTEKHAGPYVPPTEVDDGRTNKDVALSGHPSPEDRAAIKVREQAEYNSLSPTDKSKYQAENIANSQYHSQLNTWHHSGDAGPAPARPETPLHNKISAKAKAEEAAFEAVHSAIAAGK